MSRTLAKDEGDEPPSGTVSVSVTMRFRIMGLVVLAYGYSAEVHLDTIF